MTAEIISRKHESGYALSPEIMKHKTTELLREHPPRDPIPQVCYLLDGEDKYSNLARTVERRSFELAFGNDAKKMEELYGRYEAQSRFILETDYESRKSIGTIRLIENGPAGLMTTNDLAESSGVAREDMEDFVCEYHNISSFDTCVDIGTLAVDPEYRFDKGSLASIRLYRGMYLAAMSGGAEHFISMIDVNAHRILKKYLGIPFVPLAGAEPRAYEGSGQTYPVYGKADEFLRSANRKRDELREKFGARGLPAHLEKAFAILVDGVDDDAYQFAVNKELLTLE